MMTMQMKVVRVNSEPQAAAAPAKNERCFLVLSIGDMERTLKAARLDARLSSAHPGKAPTHFTRVIYADILGQEHNGSEGERHISSTEFMRSAEYLVHR